MTSGVLVELGTTVAAVVLLDQSTKALARRGLAGGATVPARAGAPVRFRLVLNRRPGLGLVRDHRVLILVWALLAVVTALLVHTSAADRLPTRLGLGLALGGAAGNLVDRLRHGAVVDFVDLRVWPVFNVADVGIVAGAALVLWTLWTAT